MKWIVAQSLLLFCLMSGCAMMPWQQPWWNKEKPKSVAEPSKGMPAALDISQVEERQDGLWYVKGSKEPHTGRVFQQYETGNTAVELTLQKGLREGPYTAWHENETKQIEVVYRLGRVEGMGREWFFNGKLKREALFRNGKTVANKEWLANGTQKILLEWNPDGSSKTPTLEMRKADYKQIEFRNTEGQLDGRGFGKGKRAYIKGETSPFTGAVISRYDTSGKIREEWSVREGYLDGMSSVWHEEGWRQFEFDYRAGKVVRMRVWNSEGRLISSGKDVPQQ